MANNWLHSSPYAPLPPQAVVGGYDSDGSTIYVGRSFHEGDCIPTKVIPSKRAAYVSWAGAEHPKSHYELLLGDGYTWQPCFGASIPPNAISAGKTSSGEPLYVGRGHYASSLTVGKVQPSHGCLYIPFQGGEIKLEKYEVLVYGGGGVDISGAPAAPPLDFEAYKWVHSSAYSNIPPNAVVGGNDFDGDMIYVGRAFHQGDMLVIKVIPAKKLAFGSWRGEEIPKDHFEILCGRNLVWRHCYNHMIPDNAVECGTTSLDQPVYIGRGHYEGSLTVGRVSKVHRALFIPFRGVERRLETYEILVEEKNTAGWKVELVTTDPLPPPPPLTPETVCPYPSEKSPCPYPEIKPPMPMPMPTPVDPPPPYTPMPSAMPMPMPAPATTYQPPSYPPPTNASTSMGFSPAYTYVLPGPSYRPPVVVPAATYTPTTYEKWVPVTDNYLPGGAVHAGHDCDMSTIYVCRAFHNGDILPGKFVSGHGSAYVSYGGQEIPKYSCEMLVGDNYIWVPAINGFAPGAVEAGRTSDGEVLYVGRAHYNGSLTCGKIHRSHGCLFIPFGGCEIAVRGNYDILVRRNEYYAGQGMYF
uniref:Uncharacterized protein n=1 Tax=Stomoxys calcitrans TaxID=35570 RepID=A0A1I8NTG7_STOCA